MNWGNKLLVTYIVFIAGMGYLVYRSLQTNFELVEKEYYKSELNYQTIIDGTHKANTLVEPVRLLQNEGSIILQLPPEMRTDSVIGRVWFYCAYNAKSDQQIALTIDANGQQVFDPLRFNPGQYTVKVEWKHKGHSYYFEQPIQVL